MTTWKLDFYEILRYVRQLHISFLWIEFYTFIRVTIQEMQAIMTSKGWLAIKAIKCDEIMCNSRETLGIHNYIYYSDDKYLICDIH